MILFICKFIAIIVAASTSIAIVSTAITTSSISAIIPAVIVKARNGDAVSMDAVGCKATAMATRQ